MVVVVEEIGVTLAEVVEAVVEAEVTASNVGSLATGPGNAHLVEEIEVEVVAATLVGIVMGVTVEGKAQLCCFLVQRFWFWQVPTE